MIHISAEAEQRFQQAQCEQHAYCCAGEHGWPSSTEFSDPPHSEDEQAALIDALQDWKSLKYQEIIGAFHGGTY